MPKNLMNSSPERDTKGNPSKYRDEREKMTTMSYFRAKKDKKVSKNNEDKKEKKSKEKSEKKRTRFAWLGDYLKFVRHSTHHPLIKHVLHRQGITPDHPTYIDHVDAWEQEKVHSNRTYDPRHNDDVKEL